MLDGHLFISLFSPNNAVVYFLCQTRIRIFVLELLSMVCLCHLIIWAILISAVHNTTYWAKQLRKTNQNWINKREVIFMMTISGNTQLSWPSKHWLRWAMEFSCSQSKDWRFYRLTIICFVVFKTLLAVNSWTIK